jgi:hypothetical protein
MRELSYDLVHDFVKNSGLDKPFVAMKSNGVDLKFYYFKNEKNPEKCEGGWVDDRITVDTIKFQDFCKSISSLLDYYRAVVVMNGDIYLCEVDWYGFNPILCLRDCYKWLDCKWSELDYKWSEKEV